MTNAPLALWQIDGVGPCYAPAGAAPRPAIMILHGSEGPGAGWSHRFAAILAAHGFAAVPHGYGTGDVWGASSIEEVDIGAIAAAARRLACDPRVGRAGLLGWSRGGELAMHLAALGGEELPVAAIAAHAPADHVVDAFDIAAFRAGRPPPEASPGAGPRRAWVWAGHDAALAPGTPIAVERCRKPVFLSVGDADAVWDPAMTLRLARRLEAAGNPADLWVAASQGHAFDVDAEPEFWRRLTAFFDRHLGAPAG